MAGRGRSAALPLRTARLALREFVPADRTALRTLALDPRVFEYAPAQSNLLGATRRSGAAGARRTARPRSYMLAVELERSGRLIGACDLALTGSGSADFGYMIAPRHWGRGYGTEVARALVAFAFERLALERLSAVVAIDNDRSRRVLEKAGLVWDSLMRRHARARDRSLDCHRYVIDRRRWRGISTHCSRVSRRGS